MDDEEDDVFEPDTNCNWQQTTYREIKCKDQGTQTHGPTPAPANGMLPCGVAEEPRQLFIGNAGYRLHFPAHFELGGDQGSRQQEREDGEAVEEEEAAEEEEASGPEERQRQPWGHSMEAHIGQKLRLVADQFHREHVQLYHRNQRHHGPLWWRLASTLLSLLFDRGGLAGRGGAGRR